MKSSTAQTAQETPAYAVDAEALDREYAADHLAADNRYRRKVVVLSGVVREITRDLLDQPVITVGKGIGAVECTFLKTCEFPVARLSRGQAVSVRGRITGKIIWVELHECTLQSAR